MKYTKFNIDEVTIKDKNALFEIACLLNARSDESSVYYPYAPLYATNKKDTEDKVIEFINNNDIEKSMLSRRVFRSAVRDNGRLIGMVSLFLPYKEQGKSMSNGSLGLFAHPLCGRRVLIKNVADNLLNQYFMFYDDIEITAHPKNLPSIRLIEKIGGTFLENIDKSSFDDEPRKLFVLNRSAYLNYVKKYKVSLLNSRINDYAYAHAK